MTDQRVVDDRIKAAEEIVDQIGFREFANIRR